ncbi:MAG: DUF4783 domain-containing protein [Flavobacteriales bacterium]|nr:DUF4783 domain-containing protein [Flavobacteriales bacterium]
MKRLLLLALFCIPMIGAVAQDAEKDRVVDAIKMGDAKELSALFIASIDLTVKDASDVYSKAQAEQILRKFFNENPPVDLVIEHSGVSKSGDKYFIGILRTRTGYFRTTFFLKKGESGFLVKQLRIENSKNDF